MLLAPLSAYYYPQVYEVITGNGFTRSFTDYNPYVQVENVGGF